jgi:CheY-like chemotaxis protein
LELESIEFSLRNLIGKTGHALGMRAADKGLEMACRIAPNLSDMLVGDPGRLRQIVTNLVGNSLKFTEKGEIVINVEEDSKTDSEIGLHVSVKDTGIGIPPEQQKKVLDAFTQADASTTRKFGGTGLGLAICKSLVSMMKGRIWLESEVGKGTTFHFTAWFRLGKDQPQKRRTELSALRNLPVLVVDDNRTNRRIFQEILASWNMAPSVVESGSAALEQLESAAQAGRPFRVALLDCMMPEMDGFTLAKQIGGNQALGSPTMIMVSSAARPGDSERCQKLGIARHMTKPVVQSELLEAILHEVEEEHLDEAGTVESGEHVSTACPSRRILLAEDGLVNQRVAIGLLKSRGHEVVVANNGREAIELLDKQSFDGVLMDVQMPEMDGFRATAEIRGKEEQTGQHIPIIAMTASAMKGDRERCLAAGMDGYISKPIDPEQLYQTILTFHPSSSSREPKSENSLAAGDAPAGDSPGAAEILDLDAARERFGDDPELIREMAEIVLDESPKLLRQILEGCSAGDSKVVQRSAHTLKSSIGVFGAQRACDLSWRIEQAGKAGNLQGLEEIIEDLQQETARAMSALTEFLKS